MWILFLLLVSKSEGAKCRALALAAGGSYGSYEAGAIQGLISALPAEESVYDIIVGISAGSLNTIGMAQYPKGEEAKGAAFNVDILSSMDGPSRVYRKWPGGLSEGVFFKSSLLDNTPLKELLDEKITDIKRNITIGCSNLEDGSFEKYSDLGVEDMKRAVMCSTAIPSVFPVYNYDGKYLVDGGVIYRLDLFTAIQRCIDIAGSQEDVIIDMIETYDYHLKPWHGTINPLKAFYRVRQIKAYDVGMHNLYWAMTAYPNVTFRHYIEPSMHLAGIVSFDFRHESLVSNIKLGFADAVRAVEKSIFANDIIDKWEVTPSVSYA